MRTISILEIIFHVVNKKEAYEEARRFLYSSQINLIFTPNPEMLVEATHDPHFKNTLNQGDLNLCDGFGLKLAAPELTRISGADFMLDLCALAEQEQKSIYLLGSGSEETLKKAVENLQKKLPRLKIAGTDPGYTIALIKTDQGNVLQCNQDERAETLHRIIMAAPDILFVAFGHNKQETWIVENSDHLPSVKIAMGVGGAIDYLGEKIKRAPKWMRDIGLEWLWRLLREPRRIVRIVRATVIFPFLVFIKKEIPGEKK
jgi:N-acetylglucosaminyldiphosphoundecaprenol N-acetyl-beta-D-mannosaminyltransferase